MIFTEYFVKHPVIALILNAMIILVGYLSLESLPVREYPEIHFSSVQVRTVYPNASPEIVETSVTNPLEDHLAGIEGIETMTSNSKYGVSQINITFKKGTSIDQSLILIREALSLVELPIKVKPPIVERNGNSKELPFMIISLESSLLDFGALTHYANLNIKNIFRSIKGVASADIWGQPYTYTIVLDPKKMFAFGVNADEVYDALQQGNLSLPAGKFQNEVSVTINSELKSIKDYENLVVKSKDFSQPKTKKNAVFLKEIADISLQTDNDRFRIRINGKPGLSIAIQKSNDANPLDVSQSVHKHFEEIKETLPSAFSINIISDQADFIRSSLKNVKSSLVEAILFVLVIVFLFLGNINATLIPLITIPISMMGSLLFLKIFGFSINIMTLLAMVLAIGLVVDDAIIMLENIQRHLEQGLKPIQAALKGAKEIGFAIVAMTLTLTSVYTPLAFVTGAIGSLFIEFAVALSGSVLISGIVALTLSPLMCTKILKNQNSALGTKIDKILKKLIFWYQHTLDKFLNYKKISLIIFLVSFCCIAILMQHLPYQIAPVEDRNLAGVYIPLTPGKNINDIEKNVLLVEEKIKPISETADTIVFMGEQWGSSIILLLKSQKLRTRSAQDIANSIRPMLRMIPSLDAHPWSQDTGLPGIEESIQGGALSLIISSTKEYKDLFKAVEKAKNFLEDQKFFLNVYHDLKLDAPGYRIDLNKNEMAYLNITSQQIAKIVEIFFSNNTSLSFLLDGISYPITLKGKESTWDLNQLYINTQSGKKISLGAVAELVATSNPLNLYHDNQMRSVELTADLPEGETIDEGMKKFFKQVDQNLSSSFKKTWSGNAKIFKESKMTMITLFILAIIFIYAILAIQFENFIDPFIILLTVPLACLGGLISIKSTGGSLNIYTQIGLITLIGLITKHGILIVEFVNQLKNRMSLREAVLQASCLRLRPILMTTGAMIFGVIPLILSNDAGHEAQRAIGIVLIGGLLIGTFFTLFVLPIVCCTLKSFLEKSVCLVSRFKKESGYLL